MFSKYRVVEIEGLFYPQYRQLFWWRTFYWSFHIDIDYSFSTLKEAKEWIADHIKDKEAQRTVFVATVHPYP